MSNLSQFGKAMIMYSMDNDENFPDTLRSLGPDYIKQPRLFICKSDTFRGPADGVTSELGTTNCSYNLVLKEEGGAEISASSPANMMLACDKNGGSTVLKEEDGAEISASSPANMMLACDKNGGSTSDAGNVDADSFGGNHQGAGGNALYVDGSVSWVNASDWDDDDTRTNLTGKVDLTDLSEY
jgi:prepilin-type processing-associated H-X9-DG protein